jgi:hypothetical protein
MTPSLDLSGLKRTQPWEWCVRFFFGGAITAATGVATHRFGPIVGGFLLAFPAILPASLTLVKVHDGRAKAADDARGARIGSIALGAFGLTVWLTPREWPAAVVLGTALLSWAIVGVAGWIAVYGVRKS